MFIYVEYILRVCLSRVFSFGLDLSKQFEMEKKKNEKHIEKFSKLEEEHVELKKVKQNEIFNDNHMNYFSVRYRLLFS